MLQSCGFLFTRRNIIMVVLVLVYHVSLCSGEYDRDIFNEKPSKEEQLNATEVCNVSVYIYIRTCMHTYKHTYMHACIHTSIHTYMHACIHTSIHTCMHAYI